MGIGEFLSSGGGKKGKKSYFFMILIIALPVLLYSVCPYASAAEITINRGASIDTFQNAVNNAGEGGTVILNQGTYKISNISCSNSTTIRANTSAGGYFYNTIVVSVRPVESIFVNATPGITMTFDSLTLTNSSGRAIFNPGGTVVLSYSEIKNCNTTDIGGGVSAYTATITESIFSSCSASSGSGGGVSAYTATITDSLFRGCSVGISGGGVSAYTATITGSIFKDCSVGISGGGILADTATISDSTFSRCSAGRYGGGIFADTATISDSTFSSCSAGSYGGGIFPYTATIMSSVFEDCYADDSGGFLYNSGTSTVKVSRIYNCTSGDGTVINTTGSVDALNNWWGNNNPSIITNGTVDTNSWLILGITASPETVMPGGTSTITSNITYNSDGLDTSSLGTIPDGTVVSFSLPDGGGTLSSSDVATVSGISQTTFTPSAPGNYNVSSCLDDQCVNTTLHITGPILHADPVSGTIPLEVAFTVTGIGVPVALNLSFGDGEWHNSTSYSGINTTHTYPTAGTYQAILNTSYLGGIYYESLVNISAKSPTLVLLAEPSSGTIPLDVVFNVSGTGIPTALNLSFGDGLWHNCTSYSEINTTHNYGVAGTYPALLNASFAGGYLESLVNISATTVPAVVTPTEVPVSLSGGSGSNTNIGIGAASDIGAGESVQLDMKNSAVDYVIITAKDDIQNIMITIERCSSLPGTCTCLNDTVCQYLIVKLYRADDSEIARGVFEFKIPKSWLEDNDFDFGDIVMMRYDDESGEWVQLPTEFISEDSENYHYRTSTPGFSVFAIAAVKGATIVSEEKSLVPEVIVVETQIGDTPGPEITEVSGINGSGESKSNAAPVSPLAVIFSAALAAIVYLAVRD